MKWIKTLFFAFVILFYSADLFAQTATDLNCTSCVQTTEIANIAITSQKLQGNSVTTAKILDGTITNADISSTSAIDASKISGTAWTSTNDGSGTALDADTLDGVDSSQFLQGGENITVDESGNVGIGTTSPSAPLDVSTNTVMGEDADKFNTPLTLVKNGDEWGTDNPALLLKHSGSGSNDFGNPDTDNGILRIEGFDTGRDDQSINSNDNFVVLTNGSVGIGTSSPGHKLDVTGDALISDTLYLMDTHNSIRAVRGEGVYIDTYNVTDPFFIQQDTGNVGIGTTNPGSFKLAVEGIIGARELKVTEDSWSDFVFKEDYPLKSLAEVESFIQQNKHLPDIPSESEVLANGVSVGDMQKRLLQKVEELTLYVIAQDKKIEGQDKKITQQDKIIAELERGVK